MNKFNNNDTRNESNVDSKINNYNDKFNNK